MQATLFPEREPQYHAHYVAYTDGQRECVVSDVVGPNALKAKRKAKEQARKRWLRKFGQVPPEKTLWVTGSVVKIRGDR